MTAILDHAADTAGTELNRLAGLYDFPDFVKRASSDECYPSAGASGAAFAHPTQRLYPCHTPAATWLSALYFAEKRAELPPKQAQLVARRLDEFAGGTWGIKAAVDALRARWEELHKDADDSLPDADFGFVWRDDAGGKQRHLRMKTAAEVKAAAAWLLEHRDALPFADRHAIATRVLEKAAQYGTGLGPDLDAFVERQAGRGVCDPQEVVAMVRQRRAFTKEADARDLIGRLADTLATKPRYALNPTQLVKLAETVDAVDRACGLAGKYTDLIRRPEDVIFRITYKEAQASVNDAVALSTGRVYDRKGFTKVALKDVQALFGGGFADDVANGLDVDPVKLAELASTMPRDDAALFERLLDESGVPPIHHKAASDRHGLRAEAMNELAAAY